MREKLLNMSTLHFMLLWIAISSALGVLSAFIQFFSGMDTGWLRIVAFWQWWGGLIWYFTSRTRNRRSVAITKDNTEKI